MDRVGLGYDVHRFAEGRKLILGGVDVPFDKGLDGHSDADVLCHAITDSLLGAAALGDIGRYFPDSDPQYKDISSIKLLEYVRDLIAIEGWEVANIDTIIIMQLPKVAPFIDQMIRNLAQALSIPSAKVSVKATTTEGLGFEGRGEGVSAQAVALLKKK